MSDSRVPDCPCGLPESYLACCGRFHGASRAEPRTAEELMRSRFSAFAKRDSAYLYRSLHPEHPDRKRSVSAFRRDLDRHFATGVVYLRLTIFDAPPCSAVEEGYVLFAAYGNVGASDFVLAELSTFVHDGTGWRYRSGRTLPESALGGRPRIADLRRKGVVS